MSSTDQQARNIDRHQLEALGAVIQPSANASIRGGLKCPYEGCDCGDFTHVVDAIWECDPAEGDRRWVRLEVRCEMGRGFLLLIRNHGGLTRFEYRLIEGVVSPFNEGVRW